MAIEANTGNLVSRANTSAPVLARRAANRELRSRSRPCRRTQRPNCSPRNPWWSKTTFVCPSWRPPRRHSNRDTQKTRCRPPPRAKLGCPHDCGFPRRRRSCIATLLCRSQRPAHTNKCLSFQYTACRQKSRATSAPRRRLRTCISACPTRRPRHTRGRRRFRNTRPRPTPREKKENNSRSQAWFRPLEATREGGGPHNSARRPSQISISTGLSPRRVRRTAVVAPEINNPGRRRRRTYHRPVGSELPLQRARLLVDGV